MLLGSARLAWLALVFLGASGWATAEAENCRIAFDMGSSGIRAGQLHGQRTPKADIDFLAPLAAGRSLVETMDPAVAALRDLPRQGNFAAGCTQVGGGFSAWRLALLRDPGALIPSLWRIRAQTGVAVLVVPQAQEGRYGYFAARQVLGAGLTSSHVLDIGGGSLQVAGEDSVFGLPFGQKTWRAHLCRVVFGRSPDCPLQNISGRELAHARAEARKQLVGARHLPAGMSLTAISRPLSRGVLPAVRQLTASVQPAAVLELPALRQAIERAAGLSASRLAEDSGLLPRFSAYLLSDMLLVEALMVQAGLESLTVAEADLTNLPGLLADEQAFRWADNYACYLSRLAVLGIDAYASDVGTCPAY